MNNGWVMSCPWSHFVSSWKQIRKQQDLRSVSFVSETTGVKMSTEMKKGHGCEC